MFAASWQIDLTDPAWLAGLALLPLLIWYFRRSLVNAGRRQRILSLVCRATVVCLVVFALAGLEPVPTGLQMGLPTLESGGKGLAGIWEGDHDLGNRILSSPALKLVAKPQVNGGRDAGYLYTVSGGLERVWRFAVNQTWADGWDKDMGTEAKEGSYVETAKHP